VPSLWRTCPNLIGPFIHPTAPQTRSVARRAMPKIHVATHHLVCSRAQSTRIICQCRILNESIHGTFIGRYGAALYEASARSRGCSQSGTAHAAPCLRQPPPALRAVPLAASFFGAASKGTVFEQQGSTRGGGGGGGRADEGKHIRVQAMGRSWKERPRLCGDLPLSSTAGPALGGARFSWRVFSARRSWCGIFLFPFTKKMKRHVSGFEKLRRGGPGMPVPCGAEFVAP